MITSISGEILIESRQLPLGIYELWRKSAQYTQTHLFFFRNFSKRLRSKLDTNKVLLKCLLKIEIGMKKILAFDVVLSLNQPDGKRFYLLVKREKNAIKYSSLVWNVKIERQTNLETKITHKSCRKRRITIKCSIKNHKSHPNAISLELSFRNT